MSDKLQKLAKDAADKVAALPDRIKAEEELAAEEERQPYEITPHTEVEPAVVAPILKQLNDVPADVAETVANMRRCCRLFPNQPFAMRSDQLLAVLGLAKVQPPKPAPVE